MKKEDFFSYGRESTIFADISIHSRCSGAVSISGHTSLANGQSSIGMLFLITLCLQLLLTILRIVWTHVQSGAIESGSFFSATLSSIKYQVGKTSTCSVQCEVWIIGLEVFFYSIQVFLWNNRHPIIVVGVMTPASNAYFYIRLRVHVMHNTTQAHRCIRAESTLGGGHFARMYEKFTKCPNFA